MGDPMRVARAGVVGAGIMGSAIAELLAFNGIDVVLRDIEEGLVAQGLARARAIVGELVRYHVSRADREIQRIRELGVVLTPEQEAGLRERLKPRWDAARGEEVLRRIHGTTDLGPFAQVDLVVEAIVERADAKRSLFAELDRVLPDHAILATNTSSLSLTRLAHGLRHAPQMAVAHFFNPPATLPLVEVAAGLETREGVVDELVEFLGGLRNHRFPLAPIRVRESPAFVVNRLLMPVLNEACFLAEEGVANPRDIDTAMKAGAGMPMGPFELADMVGLDIALEVAQTLFRELGDPKYRPSPLLRRLVDAGRLGRKVGQGFYEYPDATPAPGGGSA